MNFGFFFFDGTSFHHQEIYHTPVELAGLNNRATLFGEQVHVQASKMEAQSAYMAHLVGCLPLPSDCKFLWNSMCPDRDVVVTEAKSPDEIAAVRELFVEYAAWLGFSLAYQNFEDELASLPGKYAAPTGRLLLARVDDALAACGAIRQLEPSVCEMKRLFVKPEFRGRRIGRRLVEKLIGDARALGYSAMRLDTVAEKMGDAVRLYKALGFYEIPAYYPNARAGTRYFELQLRD